MSRAALLVLAGLLTVSATVSAEEPTTTRPEGDATIVFLTLVIKADSVRLDNWTATPGILKRPRSERSRPGIRWQAVSSSGIALWYGFLGDPLTQRLETEDPPGSGKLSTQIVTRDSAHVVVRLPMNLAADRLEFWETDRSGTADGEVLQHRLIGTIAWPPPERR